jgi:hypothetical protein
MLTTFVTVLAWIVFIGLTAWVGFLVALFASLDPWDQKRAKITVSGWTSLAWVTSLAWIITSFLG